MPVGLHPLRLLPEQDVDRLPGAERRAAEPLQPHQGRQQLLRRHRPVPYRRRRQAGVAVPACAGGRLAEVPQHLRPAAAGRLAQREHRVQVPDHPPPVREIAVGIVDEPPLLHHVGQPVGQPRRSRCAVPPGPPRLLVVALHRPGQVQVRDEPDVRLVDAHAERDRGHHDQPVLAQEPRLVGGPGPRVQPGVIRQGHEPLGRQEFRCLVHRSPGQAVHDARITAVLGAQQPQQLLARFVLRLDPVLDIGPVEAGHEMPGRPEPETCHDLAQRLPGGSGRHRDPWHRRPPLVQHRQPEVVRPEVVPPLGHAVRLVDREQRHLAPLEQPQRRVGPQPLRSQVQQVELAVQEGILDAAAGIRILGRVQEIRPHAEQPQRVDLVLHERDQRRDDHPGTVPDQRGDLVAQRLAAAGRHQRDRVPAAAQVLDDLLLLPAERAVPEHAVQHLGCRAAGFAAGYVHGRDSMARRRQRSSNKGRK